MAVLNLDLVQKDTKTYRLNFTRNDVAVNITGWTIFLTVKENFSDSDDDAIISKDVTPTGADAVAGIARIVLDSDDTNVTFGKYYYDIKAKQSATILETVLNGVFQVNKTVTQRTE
jgi:hypothetical protein